MNPVTRALGVLVRSLRIRGEEGWVAPRPVMALAAVMVGLVGLSAAAQKKADPASTAATPTHSTTIALTSDEQRLVVVNREANSVSIIRVKNAQGNDIGTKIAEIGVGEEPRCVAIHPNDQVAYVTNGISGTVSVVNLAQRRVVATVPTGHRAAGLRADAERTAALCGQPYGRHCVHHQHRLADGRRESECWRQSHRHCDHE